MSTTRIPAARGPAVHTRPDITPAQFLGFRAQLDEQHRFRLEQLAELRAIDPDNTSEVTEVLAAGARAALHEVLAALHRMDVGSYGSCTDCGTALPIERLEVLPQVGQCLPCRRAADLRSGR
jgi:RNA polymerase-binding transcription factor DksA